MSIEARTIRKVQIRIMPFIFLLYVVAFLDRVNIGFAALTMNKELAITSQQYGLLSGIFFIGYFLRPDELGCQHGYITNSRAYIENTLSAADACFTKESFRARSESAPRPCCPVHKDCLNCSPSY